MNDMIEPDFKVLSVFEQEFEGGEDIDAFSDSTLHKKACKCILSKSIKYSVNSHIAYKTEKNSKDVLFIMELPVNAEKNTFLSFIESKSVNFGFTIAYGLKCFPAGREIKNPVSKVYKTCGLRNEINIDDYKIIATLGKGLFAITESKVIESWENFGEFVFGKSFFYLPTGKKVFPLPSRVFPPLVEDAEKYKHDNRYVNHILARQLDQIDIEAQKTSNRKVEDKIITYIDLDTKAKILKVLHDNEGKDFAFDIETTGFDFWKDDIISIGLTFENYVGYFIDWELMDDACKSLLNVLFQLAKYRIGNNVKFDNKFLIYNGLPNAIGNIDGMVLHYLVNENRPHGLKYIAYELTRFGGYDNDLDAMKNWKEFETYADLYRLDPDSFKRYNVYDSTISFMTVQPLMKQCEAQGVLQFYFDFLMPAIKTFTRMEMRGIKVDLVYMQDYVVRLKEFKVILETDIFKSIGEKININSKKAISDYMKSVGIPPAYDDYDEPMLTKTGDYKLDKDAISKYDAEQYPFMKLYLEYNHVTKQINQIGDLSNTDAPVFVEEDLGLDEEPIEIGFYKKIYNQILYPLFNLIGTTTGRISSSGGINFQNMPKQMDKKRKDKDPRYVFDGLEFRKQFIPSKGCILGEADFKNAEMVYLAIIAGEESLKKLIMEGKDLHCYTGAKSSIFQIMPREHYNIFKEKATNIEMDKFLTFYSVDDEVKIKERFAEQSINELRLLLKSVLGYSDTYENFFNNVEKGDKYYKVVRQSSKSVNFGIVYGISKYGLSRQLKCTPDEAQEFIDIYFETFPRVQVYMESFRNHAIQYGYVDNIWGRKIHLPKLKDLRFYTGEYDFTSVKSPSIKKLLNNAINSPIQGAIGYLTVMSMVDIDKRIQELGLKTRMILQVHDSIVFDIPVEEIDIMDKLIVEVMEKHYDFYGDIAMKSDRTYGAVWGFGKDLSYWRDNPDKFKAELAFIDERNTLNETFKLKIG